MFDKQSNGESDDELTTGRRRVLRSVAAGGLSVGAVGTASASAGPSPAGVRRAVSEYRDADAVRERFAAESELLAAVSAAGYIDRPTVDALGVETLGAPASPTDERVGVTAHEIDGETEPALTVRKPVEGGDLVVRIRPAADRSFAVFEPVDGEPTVVAGDDVSTTSHCVSCSGISCAGCTTICGPAGSTCTDPTKEPDYW